MKEPLVGRIRLLSERPMAGWIAGLASVLVLGLSSPATLAGQSSSGVREAPARPTADDAIDWDFEPGERSGSPSASDLEERWATPFAVESRGRPAEREERAVVVRRSQLEVAADSGETAAVVEVEEGEGIRSRMTVLARGVTERTSDSSVVVAADEPSGAAAEDAGGAEEGREDEEEAAGGDEGDAAYRAEAGDTGLATDGGDKTDGDAADPADEADEPSDANAGEETPTQPRRAEMRTHRVVYGETWYGLARRYGVSSRELAAANPDVDPERLRAGTVLRIPGLRTHTVGPGDTLFGIARRYGVSANAIRKANEMEDDLVRLGRTLVIPD